MMPLLTELEILFRFSSTNMSRLRRFLRRNTVKIKIKNRKPPRKKDGMSLKIARDLKYLALPWRTWQGTAVKDESSMTAMPDNLDAVNRCQIADLKKAALTLDLV